MTTKQQLIRELDQTPETLLTEVLDFLLFIKSRHTEEEITPEEQETMIAAQIAYESGDYLTLNQYLASQV
jgi:hypothetical protein